MATLSQSKTVTLPDGALWTVQVLLDTVTGQRTVIILNQTGQQVGGTRSPAEQISFIQETLGTVQPQTARVLISAIEDLVQSVSAKAVPQTTSTGATVANAQTARDNGSTVQTPPLPPQSANLDGSVNPVSIAVPTNAQPSTPAAPTVGAGSAPPTIPGGSGTSLNSAANSTGAAPVSTLPTRSAPNLTGPGTTGESVVSYVYRAVRVVSNFSKGRFTQDVEGAQIFFDVPVDQNITVADGRANTQTVDPQALLRRPVQNPNPSILANTQFDIGDAGILPRLNINPTVLGTASTAPATSGTQPVTVPTISSLINSVTVTVTLRNGQSRTVETDADVQALLSSGQIDFREASVATAALAAKRAAQSPRTGTSYQTVKEY